MKSIKEVLDIIKEKSEKSEKFEELHNTLLPVIKDLTGGFTSFGYSPSPENEWSLKFEGGELMKILEKINTDSLSEKIERMFVTILQKVLCPPFRKCVWKSMYEHVNAREAFPLKNVDLFKMEGLKDYRTAWIAQGCPWYFGTNDKIFKVSGIGEETEISYVLQPKGGVSTAFAYNFYFDPSILWVKINKEDVKRNKIGNKFYGALNFILPHKENATDTVNCNKMYGMQNGFVQAVKEEFIDSTMSVLEKSIRIFYNAEFPKIKKLLEDLLKDNKYKNLNLSKYICVKDYLDEDKSLEHLLQGLEDHGIILQSM